MKIYHASSSSGARQPTGVSVASAVETVLATNGFKKGSGSNADEPVKAVAAQNSIFVGRRLTEESVFPSMDFTVTIQAFGPKLQEIGEAVPKKQFFISLQRELIKQGKTSVRDVDEPILLPKDSSTPVTFTFHDADWPELPQSTDGKPTTTPTPTPTPGGPDQGPINDDSSDVKTGEEELGGGIIFLIVLLILCCLWPFFCCIFARFKFGAGKEMLWMRFVLSHSNPTLPILYIPREDRQALRKRLYDEKQDDTQAQLKDDNDKAAGKDRV